MHKISISIDSESSWEITHEANGHPVWTIQLFEKLIIYLPLLRG